MKDAQSLAWKIIQFGVLLLPIFPVLSGLSLLVVLIIIWIKEFRQIVNNSLTKLLGIFSIWLIMISIFANNQRESWLGLANFIPFITVFLGFRFVINQPEKLKKIAWLLIIPSSLVVILGIGQLFFNWQIKPNFLGWELLLNGNPEGRLASVFMYANICAYYLTIVFSLNLGLWFAYLRKFQVNFTSKNTQLLIFLTVNLILTITGLILTSSRNAWGLAILISLALIIYWGWYWLSLMIVTAILTVFWASFGVNPSRQWFRNLIPEYFWGRLSDEMYPDRPLATLRKTQWNFVLEMTQQRPLIGWGLRNFTPLYEAKMNLWLGHPHNLFLMLLGEIGIPGMIFFTGIVGGIMVKTCRVFKDYSESERLILFSYLITFISCSLFNFFDVTIFDLRMNLIGWLILTSIAGLVFRESSDY
jgi:O-antigen ligase